MRWHIPILISLLVIALLAIHITNAERRCTTVNQEGKTFLLCFDVPAPRPEAPPPPPAPHPEPIPKPVPEVVHAPEPLPPGMIVGAERVGDNAIIFDVKTPNQEEAKLRLEIVDEKIGNELVKKPRLNVNLNIKNLVKIPQKLDIEIISYPLYAISILSIISILLLLWIIKDIVEPKIKI